MSDTPRLALPLIAGAQAQKHVTHNEALATLDALVHLHILDRDLTAPPASPDDGDTYLVANGATGDWAGEDGRIAFALDGAWALHDPFPGMIAYVADEQAVIVHTGAAWQEITALLSLQSVPKVGINATATDTQRLTVKSDEVIFSHDDVTPGTGSHTVTLNKAAAGDDAGHALKTGWSTRALAGLFGNDDYAIRVSPDGSSFSTALTADKDTGFVGLGIANPQQALHVGGNAIVSQSASEARNGFFCVEEELSGLSGATVDSTILIPSRAIVFCVSTRTTTAVTGAVSFDCGISGEPLKFGGSIGIGAGATNAGVIGPTAFYSNTPIRLSANGGAFTGGAVRVALHYFLPQVPQS